MQVAVSFTNSKSVMLVTSTNLACNPRCYKELKLLVSQGYKVTLVAFHLHNWTTDKERLINKSLPEVDFYYLEPTKKNIISWLKASIVQIIARFFFNIFSNNIWLASMVIDKRSWLLYRWLQQQKSRPQIIIAHNPAAFYPAYQLAKKLSILFALDIEDFHPGESMSFVNTKAVSLLMKQIIPKACYVSYASPLIKKHTELMLDGIPASSLVVNNFFSFTQFENSGTSKNNLLQFVWFSQNIDFGRGLEALLPVIDKFSNRVELTLIGNFRKPFFEKMLKGRENIIIKKPLDGDELIKLMSQFDIGLAIEPGKDLNNTIALSNKILTYFQSGLYIIASDTLAQQMFMNEHPDHGVCTSLAAIDLTTAIEKILENSSMIKNLRQNRFKKASDYNWENESKQLLNQWKAIVQ
jgi:glycosyltransferase involved in cell wall biosynthesis